MIEISYAGACDTLHTPCVTTVTIEIQDHQNEIYRRDNVKAEAITDDPSLEGSFAPNPRGGYHFLVIPALHPPKRGAPLGHPSYDV